MDNARGYDIRSRLEGMTEWWSEGAVYPNTWASWHSWVTDGMTWEYQVRTVGNKDDRSPWSDTVTVTAYPETAPGPINIIVQPSGDDAIQFCWVPVEGYPVDRYATIVWDLDTEGALTDTRAYPAGAGARVDSLKPGHRYGCWVSTYVSLNSGVTGKLMIAGGFPAAAREVIVGRGAPTSSPKNLQCTYIDTATIELKWDRMEYAAGYGIYSRSIKNNTPFELLGTTTDTRQSIGLLFPSA